MSFNRELLQYEAHFQLAERIGIGLKELAGFPEIARFPATGRFPAWRFGRRKGFKAYVAEDCARLADLELMFVDT